MLQFQKSVWWGRCLSLVADRQVACVWEEEICSEGLHNDQSAQHPISIYKHSNVVIEPSSEQTWHEKYLWVQKDLLSLTWVCLGEYCGTPFPIPRWIWFYFFSKGWCILMLLNDDLSQWKFPMNRQQMLTVRELGLEDERTFSIGLWNSGV